MKEKVQELAKTAWKMIRKVVKKPWEFTGPTSHPEYMEANQPASLYRRISPATPEVRVSIPFSEPEHIFDIKHYARVKHPPASKVDWEYDPHNPEHIQYMKDYIDKMPLPRFWVMGEVRGVGDEERADGGYQGDPRVSRAAAAAASGAKA